MSPLARWALNWLARRYTARVADVALHNHWSMAPYLPELTQGRPLDVKRVLAWYVAELRTTKAINEELLKDLSHQQDAGPPTAPTMPAELEDVSRWMSNLGGLEVPAPTRLLFDKEAEMAKTEANLPGGWPYAPTITPAATIYPATSPVEYDFGGALDMLRAGLRVGRRGWNGKGMWLQLVQARDWSMSSDAISNESPLQKLPWIGMKTADGCFVPWLASQTDMLASDWVEVAHG